MEIRGDDGMQHKHDTELDAEHEHEQRCSYKVDGAVPLFQRDNNLFAYFLIRVQILNRDERILLEPPFVMTYNKRATC